MSKEELEFDKVCYLHEPDNNRLLFSTNTYQNKMINQIYYKNFVVRLMGEGSWLLKAKQPNTTIFIDTGFNDSGREFPSVKVDNNSDLRYTDHLDFDSLKVRRYIDNKVVSEVGYGSESEMIKSYFDDLSPLVQKRDHSKDPFIYDTPDFQRFVMTQMAIYGLKLKLVKSAYCEIRTKDSNTSCEIWFYDNKSEFNINYNDIEYTAILDLKDLTLTEYTGNHNNEETDNDFSDENELMEYFFDSLIDRYDFFDLEDMDELLTEDDDDGSFELV